MKLLNKAILLMALAAFGTQATTIVPSGQLCDFAAKEYGVMHSKFNGHDLETEYVSEGDNVCTIVVTLKGDAIQAYYDKLDPNQVYGDLDAAIDKLTGNLKEGIVLKGKFITMLKVKGNGLVTTFTKSKNF
ncbi:hypothetical protein [Vibrio algivorus]|uniref:Sterol carrier protein n=1 Tax=Vibrio algivorus TaxID=1667024 RepID=A0ABQ6ETU5_9VIBR|nr:hypothetical protein [Vibrio algivorus]GLT16166.1 hypothetical protein GCM10007931_31420 [Vibrio algivorus]